MSSRADAYLDSLDHPGEGLTNKDIELLRHVFNSEPVRKLLGLYVNDLLIRSAGITSLETVTEDDQRLVISLVNRMAGEKMALHALVNTIFTDEEENDE